MNRIFGKKGVTLLLNKQIRLINGFVSISERLMNPSVRFNATTGFTLLLNRQIRLINGFLSIGKRLMNPSVRFNATTGFTLTEVLVSLIILAVGILAIAEMQIISIKGTSFSRYLTRASVLAQDSLESLRSLPITDEKFVSGPHSEPDYEDPDIGTFRRRYQAAKNPDYVTIQYTVEWEEKGISHSVSFSTIKSR